MPRVFSRSILVCLSSPGLSLNKQPNILLITSDQQRGDCYGFENPEIKTPHLDRLARDGTRFSACITPNLVCQPSRASILTGLLPLTHGVWDNGVDLDPRVGAQGFAGTLARSGYQTAFIGKAHFATKSTFAPTGTPECNKSQAQYGPRLVRALHGIRARGAYGARAFAPHASARTPADGPLRALAACARPRRRGAQAVGDRHCRPTSAPRRRGIPRCRWRGTTARGSADRAIHYLEQRDKTKPFCAWVSFPDPHHAFDCPEPWSRLYDPKSVTLPQNRKKDLERRPWWHKASLEGTPQLSDPAMLKFRAEGSRVPDQTDEQLAHMTANYYGMISLIDHNVGRILEALAAQGLAGRHAGHLHHRSRRTARQPRAVSQRPDAVRRPAARRIDRAWPGRWGGQGRGRAGVDARSRRDVLRLRGRHCTGGTAEPHVEAVSQR